MAYQQLEEIRSRKREKVALFLTAENMGGLLLATLPVYLATAQFQSFVLRVVLLVMAAVLGVAVTLEYGGLALYERILWRIRGFMRVQTAGSVLTPEQFSPVPAAPHVQLLPVDGLVRVVPTAQAQACSGRRLHTPPTTLNAHLTLTTQSPFDDVIAREAGRTSGVTEERPSDHQYGMAEEAPYAHV